MKHFSELKFILKILNKFNSHYKIIISETVTNKNKKLIFWKIHRLHWEKNRFIFDIKFTKNYVSFKTLNRLRLYKLIDIDLINYWMNPGYEILCSTQTIISEDYTKNKRNKNSLCRVPILLRLKFEKIFPNPLTGCISCASGDGINQKPLWWNVKLL